MPGRSKGGVFRDSQPLVYRSDAPLCLMYYSIAKEGDGVFGGAARRAWRIGADDWMRYGTVDIPWSADKVIRVGEKEVYAARVKQLLGDMDAIVPGLREKIDAEKRAKLNADQRKLLAIPSERRNKDQLFRGKAVEAMVRITPTELVQRMPAAQRTKAQALVARIEQEENAAETIQRSRDVVGWDYWTSRAQWEQEEDTLRARAEIYLGDQAFADARVVPAREAYDRGLAAWRKVLDKHPVIVQSTPIRTELLTIVKNYKEILAKREENLPKDFILNDVVTYSGVASENGKNAADSAKRN